MRLDPFHVHVCIHRHVRRVWVGQKGVTSFVNHNQFAEDVGIWIPTERPERGLKFQNTRAILAD